MNPTAEHSTVLDSFRPEALEKLAQIIADNRTGSEISQLLSNAGLPQRHDGGTKWRFLFAVFQEIQQQHGGKPDWVLKVVKAFASPQAYIGAKEVHDGILKQLNDVLSFYALRIDADGSLRRTGEKTSTVREDRSEDEAAFDARKFHGQVVLHGRARFIKGDYFHAVFECCKALDTAIQRNTGIAESGQKLMGQALALTGAIKLNSQNTQSERDEQDGVKFLAMGLMSAVRNPQAHEPELHWPMKREDALDILALSSFLYRKLENGCVYDAVNQTSNPFIY